MIDDFEKKKCPTCSELYVIQPGVIMQRLCACVWVQQFGTTSITTARAPTVEERRAFRSKYNQSVKP
jgi:hypothetical protein